MDARAGHGRGSDSGIIGETWALGSAAGCVYTQAQWSNRNGDMGGPCRICLSCGAAVHSVLADQALGTGAGAVGGGASSGMWEHQHRAGILRTNLLGGQWSGEAALEDALLDRVAQLPPNATCTVSHFNCQTARIMQYWHRADNGLISVTPSFRVQAGRGFRVRNSPT